MRSPDRAGAGRLPRSAAGTATNRLRPAAVLTAVRWEWRVWTGLVRGLLRRPDIPPGASAFTHHRALAPVRWTLAGMLVVEVAVVHLLVPAGVARTVLLVLGLYGLVWLIGYLLGSGPVRPHLFDGDRVVLRSGLTTDVTVPIEAVRQIRAVRHNRAGTATVQVHDGVLSLVDNGGTSVEIELCTPLTVTLPRRWVVEVNAVRAWVDEPQALVAAIAPRIARIE